MHTGLLNKLIYTAKKIAFSLKEKQKMTIDDHVLEHMLFYHDLAGSNLESNKETRILRADIKEAIDRENPFELSLAIKIPPTLWEEQLKNIISELETKQQEILCKLLISPKNTSDSETTSFALSHEDWRIRANAANILAFLESKEAVPALAKALSSETTGSTMSFCYIAYALGKLQGEEAKKALIRELQNDDSWLRVDTLGALSYFPFSEVADQLTSSLLQEQEALDYMSYAISKNVRPATFLQSGSEQNVRGGCRLIFGIIEAADNSFTSNLVFETESHFCLPYLVRFLNEKADPILLDTAFDLSGWISAFRQKINSENTSSPMAYLPELEEQVAILKRIGGGHALQQNVIEILKGAIANGDNQNGELVHTLRLVGKLDISQTHGLLVSLLNESSDKLSNNVLKHLIIALSQLSSNEQESADLLIHYAEKLVNVDERVQLSKSKQPVFEENARQTKTYWEILRALGNLGTPSAVSFLHRTLDDYAPDMRSCALESIIEIHAKDAQINLPQPIEQILHRALNDPSPMVQLVALLGVSKFDQSNLINDILPLINSQENTVSKQALISLAHIAQGSNSKAVRNMLEEKIKSIREEHKRKQILDIIQKD